MTGIGVNRLKNFKSIIKGENTPQPPIANTPEPTPPVLNELEKELEPTSTNQLENEETKTALNTPGQNAPVAPAATDAHIDSKPVDVPEPTIETPVKQVSPAPELNDDMFISYLKEKHGKEVQSVSDLFKEPEPVKNPIESLPEKVQQLVKYSQETGRGLDDFVTLNRDISKISSLDLAREKVSKMTGGVQDSNDIDRYLEKKLGIDLTNPNELESVDRIELDAFVSQYRNEKREEQQKYKEPIEVKQVNQTPQEPEGEFVTLVDGQKMPKEQYAQWETQRNQYLEAVTKAADNITSSSFQVKIDNNGTEKVFDLAYEYSKEDKHKMVSSAKDVSKAFEQLFQTENGLDHAKLQRSLFWADEANAGKAINSIVHKALAKQAEEFMNIRRNPNFKKSQIPVNTGNKGAIPIPGRSSANGIPFDKSLFKQN